MVQDGKEDVVLFTISETFSLQIIFNHEVSFHFRPLSCGSLPTVQESSALDTKPKSQQSRRQVFSVNMEPDTSLGTQPLVNGTDTDLVATMADSTRSPSIGSQQSAFTRLLNKINTKYSTNVITEDYRYKRDVFENQTDEAKLGLKESVFVPIVNGSSEEMLLGHEHETEYDLDNIGLKLEHLGQNLEQLGLDLEQLEKLQEDQQQQHQQQQTELNLVNGGYVSDTASERDPNITETKYMVQYTKLDGPHNGEKHKERIHLPAKENSPQHKRHSSEVGSN